MDVVQGMDAMQGYDAVDEMQGYDAGMRCRDAMEG